MEEEQSLALTGYDNDEAIAKQIQDEWNVAYRAQEGKRQEQLRRLKLYNNQARKKDKVGDPLLFTVFQTVLAALYDDRLISKWEGNEEGDTETAENLTALAEHDYRVMLKDEADYEWIWDTLFFGRGLMLLHEFDRTEGVMAPVPEVIDPMLWLRDPRASSVNGDIRGRGAMRFGGREINLSKSEMKSIPGFYNLDKIKKEKSSKNLTDQARQERQAAQGTDHARFMEDSLDENYEYNLTEWFTHIDGEKCIITLANDRKTVIRKQKIKGKKWPIIDRTIFPIAHDWDGVSIPDLIEDKQRARSIMINLGMDAAIADLHPMYLYNKQKIRTETDLNFAFNKAIPVDGDPSNAYLPMQKSNAVTVQVQNILNMLDVAAQKAVSAPEVAQGIQPAEERTLGENELVAAARGARMSLAASIFGWSERRFWNQWYWLYKQHFKEDIDEKVVRIRGSLVSAWRTLQKDNIITRIDPDVYIVSARVAEAQRQKEFAQLSNFTQLVMQSPETNQRYVMRKLGRTNGIETDELMLMFPPTIDELKAEDENQLLNENQYVKGSPYEDHIVHLEKHRDANPTPATLAHVEFHKRMLVLMRDNGLLEAPQAQGNNDIQTVEPTPSNEPLETQESASRIQPVI